MPRNSRPPDRRFTTEEIIFAVAFLAVFSLLLLPFEKVSGSPVPTVIFHGRATLFHAFVLGLNFAFCGAVLTMSLRHLYPRIAVYTKLMSILSMAVSVGVFSWLAVPLLLQRVGALLVGDALAA